jgi:hypothetical protein
MDGGGGGSVGRRRRKSWWVAEELGGACAEEVSGRREEAAGPTTDRLDRPPQRGGGGTCNGARRAGAQRAGGGGSGGNKRPEDFGPDFTAKAFFLHFFPLSRAPDLALGNVFFAFFSAESLRSGSRQSFFLHFLCREPPIWLSAKVFFAFSLPRASNPALGKGFSSFFCTFLRNFFAERPSPALGKKYTLGNSAKNFIFFVFASIFFDSTLQY